MNDTSVIKCKCCGQSKKRILAGKYPDGINKRWVDENGLEFNGLTCSICHRDRVRQRKQNKKRNSYV